MSELQIVKLENTDISGWNFETLRAELQRGLDAYAGRVYTEETIKDAKEDRSTLNKVKKVIDDARKKYKTRCLAPYEALEPQIKQLVDMVEEQRLLIDEKVKDFESRQKETKELEVRKYYDSKAVALGDLADALYPKIFDKKWVSASTTRAKYEEGIIVAVHEAAKNVLTIKAMHSPFVDTLLDVYVQTLSMDQVEAKKSELDAAAAKASLVAAREVSTETPTQKTIQPVQDADNKAEGTALRIYATQKQLSQITDFMKAIGVRYEFV